MHYTSREVYEYISKQTNDPIVERKVCAVSGQDFPIYKSDLDFYDKISPVIGGVKYAIPTPKLCPEERQRRRVAWRNEWSLYTRTCDATGRKIISVYPETSKYKVYDSKIRYSDIWNAIDYGRDYDFAKTFFENFDELNLVVPKKSLHLVDSMENCDYCNYGIYSKSCYLVMGASRSENCLYSFIPVRSLRDVDGINNTSSQYCYRNVDCIGCYECENVDHSTMCKNSSYLSFCNNCEYCLGCVNLQNKKYCILNQQYSPEDYHRKSGEILRNRDTRKEFESHFDSLNMSLPKKQFHNFGSDLSFSNYVQNGTNDIFCYIVLEAKDNKYCSYTGLNKEGAVYDGYATTQSAYTLESCGLSGYNSAFILTGEYGANNCYYCQHINDCQNCFGCTGLSHKQYCILNKQYSKEEYEMLFGKIVEHMKQTGERGENFPIQSSVFGYNDTLAQRFYPMTKEEALTRNYPWEDFEYFVNIPKGLDIIKAQDLPKTISEVGDDILDKVIICETTAKPYRITKQELDFYRKHNIPLPTKHQDYRKKELDKKAMPNEFHLRTCDHCGKEMISCYDISSPYIVYCESCYNKEIFG